MESVCMCCREERLALASHPIFDCLMYAVKHWMVGRPGNC